MGNGLEIDVLRLRKWGEGGYSLGWGPREGMGM